MTTKWKRTTFCLFCVLIYAIFYFTVYIFHLDKSFNPSKYISKVFAPPDDQEDDSRGFVVNTSGCKIPDMDPFDPSVLPFIKPFTPVNCTTEKPPLYASNFTTIYRVPEAVKLYEGKDGVLVCCYEPFQKVGQNNAEYLNCQKLEDYVHILEDEFVRVNCVVNGKSVYVDLFSFVPKKPRKKIEWTKEPLNVLIIAIDNMSRLNLIRQMNKTYRYVKTHGFVEFKGYNKVGENTFPNVMPLLTGYSAEEAIKLCIASNNFVDACPFIWKDYSSKGYLTSYGEDWGTSSTFYYGKFGFYRSPTDYFWTFYNALATDILPTKDKYYCMQNKNQFEIYQDYVKKFVRSMHEFKTPYFGLLWSNSMSHEDFNMPKIGDNLYENLFRVFDRDNLFNKTVVFFMSDHGFRWGPFLHTHQGGLESRLPFLMVRLPEWYKKNHEEVYKNLVYNTQQLITPFDLYETLKDLLEPYNINTTTPSGTRRAYSLFTKIPGTRTCKTSGVPLHWCTCQTSTAIDVNHPMVTNVVEYVMDYINFQLKGFSQCSRLSLAQVLNARLLTHPVKISGTKDLSQDYRVQFQTVPGFAQFEVVVRHFVMQKVYEKYEVMDDISRMDRYGNQSFCVSEYKLKPLCYCNKI